MKYDDESDEEGETDRRRERSPSSSPLPDVDGRRSRSPSSSPLPGADHDSDSEGSDAEGAAFAAAMKAELRGDREARPERNVKDKGKVVGKSERTKFDKRDSSTRERFSKDRRQGKDARAPKPKSTVRALSPEKIAPVPAVSAAELRLKKKEAFGKYHSTGGKRGQPNMGARMDLLLEKIRSSK